MFGFDSRAAKYTLTVTLVLCLLYGVYVIRGVLFAATVSLMLAYLLFPLVNLVNRYIPSSSRTPALAIVYLLLLGGVAALGITIGSRAADEARSLSERAPALIQRLQEAPPAGAPEGLQSMRDTLLGALRTYIYEHYGDLAGRIPGITFEVLKASGNLLYLIVIPIMSFLILKDGQSLVGELLALIDPGPTKIFAEDMLRDIHILLLQYMRALFTLCCVTLVTFAVVLASIGVPDAILLASVAFPLEFIPLVGPLVAAVAIVSVTILNGYPHLLWVVIFLAAFRLAQDYVISPRVMSAGIELHPLLVLIGVFAGSEIGGIEGTFLSVPVMALLRVVYRRIRLSRTPALKAA